MMGGAIVGGGWRCFRVPEAVAIEVVFESPFSSTSAPSLLRCFSSAAFFSLPSVMAAIPPKLCHRSNSHCGGRRMTKTTDATMSEMPSTAIAGAFLRQTALVKKEEKKEKKERIQSAKDAGEQKGKKNKEKKRERERVREKRKRKPKS